MTPERWKKIEELYHAALDQPLGRRADFLLTACAGDAELRREAELLLAQSGDGIFERPAWAHAGTVDDTRADLPAGFELGPYRIQAKIGVGGMGAVYRAIDSRLRREVAIKMASLQFLGRFEREARAIAALNHPHICTLHDVGPDFLVMELVHGDTLAARLQRGKLAIADTISFGTQIADALAAAHDNGIVHRDLKPGNLMVVGHTVKVLDFGLATSASEPSITRSNVILGTPAYMAPEQRDGKATDARTDIYALGLVLYEMATGERVAPGEAPRLAGLPERLGHVIERCLARAPEERWQSARDLQAELGWSARDINSAAVAPVAVRNSSAQIALVIAALLVVGIAFAWWFNSRAPAVESDAVRVDVSPPSGTRFVAGFGSISPDGRFLTFVAESPAGGNLFLRSLDSQATHELPGTGGATFPFWSPDSRSLGFFAAGKLRRLDIAGGTPTELCDVPIGRGGTWNDDGVIVFNAVNDGPLLQVPATGGAPRPLTTLDVTRHENSHRNPTFLPDGRHFLYFIRSDDREVRGIYVGSMERPQERIRLVPSDFSGIFSPGPGKRSGHLLWLRNGSVVAQPLDVTRFTVSGEVVTLADSIRILDGPANFSPVSASRNGTLVYGSSPEPHYQLTWYTRAGKPVGTVGAPDAYLNFRISPDGQRVAIHRAAPSAAGLAGTDGDIWLMDFERGLPNRVTFDGAQANGLAWSPDRGRIAYLKAAAPPNLAVQSLTTAGSPERLVSSPNSQSFPDWSSDGRFLLYAENVNDPSSTTRADLRLLSLDGTQKTAPYLQTPFAETRGRFSPDSKWVAYTSDESGRNDVYVQRFPVAGLKRRISSQGGDFARWRQDGSELFYTAPDNTLMAVTVKAVTGSLTFGEPKPLFKIAGRTGAYDLAPDGQRILALPPAGDNAASSMTIVVHWPKLLKK